MFDDKRIQVRSVEQLISSLEHVEENELQADIPQNLRAELRRMKRNISAVLSFVEYSSLRDDIELRRAAGEIRRQCLLMNGMISGILFLQCFHVRRQMCVQFTSRVIAHYREMAEATRQVCLRAAPELAGNLTGSL